MPFIKGYKQTPAQKEKLRLSKFGKKHSEDWKKRIGDAHRGLKIHSEESKKKIGDAHRGLKFSEESRKKMSESQKRNPNRYWLGKTGESHPSWRGGISSLPYSMDWKDDLKESIRKRDNYICQECGSSQDEQDRKLDVHHIDYDKENCNPNNLISLCRNCHVKTNFNRKMWIEKFQNDLIIINAPHQKML